MMVVMVIESFGWILWLHNFEMKSGMGDCCRVFFTQDEFVALVMFQCERCCNAILLHLFLMTSLMYLQRGVFTGLDNSWRVSTLTFLNVCCIVHNMKP